MDGKKKKIIIIATTIILSILAIVGIIFLVQWIRVKNAKIEVVLKKDLEVEFAEKKKVSDFISSINGKIINNDFVDTTKLGKKKVKFQFINDDDIKVSYEYQIEVVDKTKPLIWLNSVYSVLKGSDIDLTKKIFCGDNYDPKPKCTVVGTYDMNTVGDYPLVFQAEDSSGNKEEKAFTLHVYEPQPVTQEVPSVEPVYTNFSDVVTTHKTKDTKIGIDVSSYQGEIDFEKLKNAGVEFVMIRVGSRKGIDTEYFVDKQFERNVKEAKKYGIDAGIYFYSYANTVKSAKEEAKWVIRQIKKYDIKLPVAFDWENWNYYNDYELSFFGLTSIADTFLKEIKKAGYDTMIYSSKNYLEYIWFPTEYDVWLAHYTDQTNYEGDYKMWQLCSDGKVDGIEGRVDIDILYQNTKKGFKK